MIAVCSIGDCEILILRRNNGSGPLQPVFHTEMQRIDGNAQAPLQLARVDDSVDPDFDPSIAIEVIERGSAVHCVSSFEGDIVVAGSDGVFDNLFIDEILQICEEMLPPPAGKFRPVDRNVLGTIARRIVMDCHAKTASVGGKYKDAPIGKGGKIDDTSCLVAQVVEWTEAHGEAWKQLRSKRMWNNIFSCGGVLPSADEEYVSADYEAEYGRRRNYPTKPNANSFSTYAGSFHAGNGYDDDDDEEYERPRCSIM
jgi:hypothetical protein